MPGLVEREEVGSKKGTGRKRWSPRSRRESYPTRGDYPSLELSSRIHYWWVRWLRTQALRWWRHGTVFHKFSPITSLSLQPTPSPAYSHLPPFFFSNPSFVQPISFPLSFLRLPEPPTVFNNLAKLLHPLKCFAWNVRLYMFYQTLGTEEFQAEIVGKHL